MPRLLFVLLLLLAAARGADPVADLAGFSVFPTADLAQLQKEVRAARGPASPVGRHLSVQSCYVVPGSPAKALETLQTWDPTRHRELGISLHLELPAAPLPGDFSRLGSDTSAVAKSLVAATQKADNSLQISREESKKLEAGKGAPLRDFWPGLLATRTATFAAGGAGRQPAYDFTGQEIKPGDELVALLKNQPKIRAQFAGLLGEAGVTGGRPSLKQDYYGELLEVDHDGVLTLGAFCSKSAGGGLQAMDVLYYASGGYYVALTLYQFWPVEAGGQPSTLVWRGDFISAASLGALHGIEKTGAESSMMKDISRAVNLLKKDTTGR